MKKYKILHLPTGTVLYKFSAQIDPFMLFSELEAEKRIQRNKQSNDLELYFTEFTLDEAESRLKYCYSNVVFSFVEDAEELYKQALYPHHVSLIEVKDV